MPVGHDPTVTVTATLVAPSHASTHSAVTARVSPGPRFTGIVCSDPRVRPARWVTKCATTDAAPWYEALFFRSATGNAARSNVPTPVARIETLMVSGGR